MPTLIKQFTFVADTNIAPNQVNANFDDIVSFINNELIHKDGTRAMTAHLSLLAADPASDNQAARKAYVDAKANASTGVANAAQTAANNAQTAANNAQVTADRRARGLDSNSAQAPVDVGKPDWNVTSMLIQGGTAVVNTNASGTGVLTFPSQFPNACLAVVANPGALVFNHYLVFHDSGSKGAIAFDVFKHDGTKFANSTIRITYIALGW